MKYLIGIQPTGRLHIGNYLGCIKRGLQLQNDGHEVIWMVAQYHAWTTGQYNPYYETQMELKRLGCKDIVIQTPAHIMKFWELCCKLNLGTLLKMPQYKDKKDEFEFDLGLLLYPVLMAADIIVHSPDIVLIGEDQIPHIELTNDIAKRIGESKEYKYGFGDISKVMSLQDPTKKMSKSLGDKHVLYLHDEDYSAKLRKAVTDENGLNNLRAIAKGLDIELDPLSSNLELKELIADRMKDLFSE